MLGSIKWCQFYDPGQRPSKLRYHFGHGHACAQRTKRQQQLNGSHATAECGCVEAPPDDASPHLLVFERSFAKQNPQRA